MSSMGGLTVNTPTDYLMEINNNRQNICIYLLDRGASNLPHFSPFLYSKIKWISSFSTRLPATEKKAAIWSIEHQDNMKPIIK